MRTKAKKYGKNRFQVIVFSVYHLKNESVTGGVLQIAFLASGKADKTIFGKPAAFCFSQNIAIVIQPVAAAIKIEKFFNIF